MTTTDQFDAAAAIREALMNTEPRERLHIRVVSPTLLEIRPKHVLMSDDEWAWAVNAQFRVTGSNKWIIDPAVPSRSLFAATVSLAIRQGFTVDSETPTDAYLSRPPPGRSKP